MTPSRKRKLARLAARPDSEIDVSEIPPLKESFWENAVRNPLHRLAALMRSLPRHDHLVGIALLGQEQLAVVGELLLAGVARNQREEMRGAAVGLGPQDAPQPLRLFLARRRPG